MKNRLPLAYQILALQVCIVVLAAGVGLVLAGWQASQELDRQYQQRSLAIAESVAAMPSIKSALLAGDPTGSIQATAQDVRDSTGASYVVVTDRRGIRFSHPNPALIGRPVDESPGPVLAGHTWVGVQRGTLGDAARGKAPIFAGRDHEQVIGMVSVGFPEATVSSQLLKALPSFLAIVLLALGLGVAGSLLLGRHLKRQTFGLEPYEIAGLLEEREASLQGIREGALATDADDRITLANEEVRRLLRLDADCVGRRLSQVLPPGRLRDFLAGRLRDEDEVLLAGDRVLLASRRPVTVRGREVGHVMTFRDSRELSSLSSGFGVDTLTAALRAQAHEFSNRLHAIAGLVELGRGEEAIGLITETSGMHQQLSEALMERIGDPVLGAVLLAKAAVASERGIELRVAEDTVLTQSPLGPEDLITLLGNLVDNALDAAAQSAGERWVSVAVGVQGRELVIRVQDSGPGVPEADRERVFAEGFSTRPRTGGRRRGIGLALVREVVRRYGGQVTVAGEAGAIFTARLPLRMAVAS